jgi:hypothetical protein
MAFSVSKSRPFRSLGLYKSTGKHAAPKGSVPAPRKAAETAAPQGAPEPGAARHPAHAATSPRLTSPGATAGAQDDAAPAARKTAA